MTSHITGVFRKGIDGVDVSAVTVHPGGRLVAASYRNGDVRLYRYPCQSQQVSPPPSPCLAHCQHYIHVSDSN